MTILEHHKKLSIIYWNIVDKLTKNGFNQEYSKDITTNYFKSFKPYSREELNK